MPEMLVALLLTLGLGLLLVSLASSMNRASLGVVHRMEVVEARRLVRDLVGWIGRVGGTPRDGDGLRSRVFVGWALACESGPGYRYRGRRAPDPSRDSVWWVGGDGSTGLAALERVSRSECGDGSPAWSLAVGDSLPVGLLLRTFESGRFTVSDALRYAREGTRPQPLTAAVLDPGRSGLTVRGGRIQVRLTGVGDSLGVGAVSIPRR